MRKLFANMVFASIIIAFTITSCQEPVLFDKTKEINQPWLSENKMSFLVNVKDTLTPFNFLIQVRNDVDYKYSNLFLFLRTTFPDGRFAMDTVNIWLANPDGQWVGKGFGKFRDTEVYYKKEGRFPMSGQYRFEFEQAMRVKELFDIESLGIRIEYGKQNN